MSGERELALLSAIGGGSASQRELSRRVGLSLGGTNELRRSHITRGFARARAVNGRTRRYELTPSGAEERRRRAYASTRRVVMALLAGPDAPASARRPAARLIRALAS